MRRGLLIRTAGLLHMSIDTLIDQVPDYARDLRLNLSTLLRQAELTPQQTWGTAVASAIASRNSELLQTILEEAAKSLTPEAMNAAKTASALMGMNNIYYRFLHLSHNPKYKTIPARLRMNGIRTHGIDQ